ncbi:P-loop containing nucleoside triphosphate hydrolase protein [Thamnocephalis sphaerospora]|uniref:RNA helicase n=1 Tax=Thamnocephalis sphaerospora TaxID=78915 RepID=A0A4P9XQN7_9FUNG|nr:P-loop containing nucleoside triphosphate hydrolase protein [Thamnocephalis sphaerospora]|eukprot:RKP08348.1 P-loop containing nucleoside triphosphate hydrolase protein [Thamnocephalis sphaerospora]
MARKTVRRKRPMSAEEKELELVSDGSDASDVQLAAAGEDSSEESANEPAAYDDDSDFLGLDGNDSDADSASDDSDFDMDVASALIPKARGEKTSKSSRTKRGATGGDDSDDDSDKDEDMDDDDGDDDEAFIAHQMQNSNKKKKKSGGFQSMGLTKPIFNAVLKKGYKVPTPIQRKCIPLVMEGNDVVGMARTGSGKTAAFLIPMLERLKSHSAKVGARAIVLSPSRELAMQTQKATRDLARFTDLRSCVIVGGDSLEDQFRMIASNPDILIATPGRLLHLMVEMELDLRTVEYMVFDEADRLFEMGFSVQLHEILHRLPPSRQTLLFSATLPKMLVDFAKAGLQDPTLVRLDADTKISSDLEMAFFALKQEEKEAALLYLLRDVIKAPLTGSLLASAKGGEKKKKKKKTKKTKKGQSNGEEDDDDDAGEGVGDHGRGKIEHQTIVFVATKHHVEYISGLLSRSGYAVSYIYGSLDQVARRQQIDNFRRGLTGILVVTDVAARGIDIPVLENVINYDFVDGSKVFVHRVGRAARAGRRGWAYSLIAPNELPFLVDLHLFLARPLRLGTRAGQAVDYAGEMVLGTLPRALLEDDVEWVQRQIEDDTEVHGMQGVVQNAYRMYYRSRGRAAAESYKRSKELLSDKAYPETHPLLADKMSGSLESARANLVAAISNFRPNETIFEIGNRGKTNEAAQVVRQRRAVVGAKIEAVRVKKAVAEAAAALIEDTEPGTHVVEQADEKTLQAAFKLPAATSSNGMKQRKTRRTARDEEFYMSHYQKDANTEKGYSMTQQGTFTEQARGAVLDFTGEDEDEMKSKRSKLRWDAKKKKFVQGTGIGADNKKMVRTESGALIPATYKSGRYNEWQEKTRINIPRVGEQELAGGRVGRKRYRHNRTEAPKEVDQKHVGFERQQKKLRKRAGDGDKAAAAGAKKPAVPVKSDLKNVHQIRKERELKERRRAKTGRHKPTKGKRK